MDKWFIKRVKCEWCENEYKQKGELKTQRKSGHKESSYSCDKCENKYKLKMYLLKILLMISSIVILIFKMMIILTVYTEFNKYCFNMILEIIMEMFLLVDDIFHSYSNI